MVLVVHNLRILSISMEMCPAIIFVMRWIDQMIETKRNFIYIL
jgi:hypothetical protein